MQGGMGNIYGFVSFIKMILSTGEVYLNQAICHQPAFSIYFASARGFCAGVDRAIEIVERALQRFGPPIYVRHAIVHNQRVVKDLAEKGVVFVEDLKEIPVGSITIFSAHGVSPKIKEEAKRRNLIAIDATCPLVTKVHLEALHYLKEGYSLLLIGHRHHVEVEGTLGYAPDKIQLIETPEDAEKVEVPQPDKVAVLTQTTLSVDDTRQIITILKKRFPKLTQPGADDICYATQNRQDAVKALAQVVDLILVIGSRESSNSNRLKEVALSRGAKAYLIPDGNHLKKDWFQGVQKVGITAGASTPELLVQEVVAILKGWGGVVAGEIGKKEDPISFKLPHELE